MGRFVIKSILIILITFPVVGCNNFGKKFNFSENEPNCQFDSFKGNFTNSKLPIIIKGNRIESNKFVELSMEKFPLYLKGNVLAYCSFITNGDYIGIVTLGEADDYIPILTTYDKAGNKIDEKTIFIGGGSDCGYECEEFMTLRSDYSIY